MQPQCKVGPFCIPKVLKMQPTKRNSPEVQSTHFGSDPDSAQGIRIVSHAPTMIWMMSQHLLANTNLFYTYLCGKIVTPVVWLGPAQALSIRIDHVVLK